MGVQSGGYPFQLILKLPNAWMSRDFKIFMLTIVVTNLKNHHRKKHILTYPVSVNADGNEERDQDNEQTMK